MMIASNAGAGQNMGFPDVCLTPAAPSPVPVPYPNIGMNSTELPHAGGGTILFSGCPAHNQGGKPAMTSGDEAGSAGMFKMAGMCMNGNPKILLGGMPAEHLTSPSAGNNSNNSLGSKSVPSSTNVLLARLGATAPAASGLLRWTPALLAEVGCELTDASNTPVRGALLAAGFGLLTIRRCSFGAPALARRELERLIEAGARTLVLDLRGNPGGSLESAAELAGLFLPPGALLAQVARADGGAQRVTAVGRGPVWRGPLVAWIDERSASSAEALAAALQDHQRGALHGRASYGKGVGEELRVRRIGSHAHVEPTGCAVALRRPSGHRLTHVEPGLEGGIFDA